MVGNPYWERKIEEEVILEMLERCRKYDNCIVSEEVTGMRLGYFR